MDPPYSSRRFRYTHLSITVEEQSQLHLIDEVEARYRLGSAGPEMSNYPGAGATHSVSNKDILADIVGESLGPSSDTRRRRGKDTGAVRAGSQTGSKSAAKSGNQNILQQIRRGDTSSSTGNSTNPTYWVEP